MRGNDPEKRLYGFLYLVSDHSQVDDVSEAARYLLEAEGIAQASGNPGWQGWVIYRKGGLFLKLKNFREALRYFEAARVLCGQAKDSLCLAEILEQMGSMYSLTGDYEQAHRYYDLALPLIEQYGGETQLSTTLSNFANLLTYQNRFKESIPYYERALATARKLGNKKSEIIYLNNLADTYRQLGRFDIALEMFKHCVVVNLEKGWLINVIDNYASMAQVYEQTGNFRLALDFSHRYHNIQDSLFGVETQLKIATLQAKYDSQQKELELQKSQTALSKARQKLERGLLLFFFMLVIAAVGLWRWRLQMHQAKRERQQNQESLAALTRILLDKNVLLAALHEQLEPVYPSNNSPIPDGFEQNLYAQRILTDADWAAFKVYFEKAYPGFLQRLRDAYPALSDAEERLFLFIKLNLTSKESAAILGISTDSIKKTRNRLRKRLGLEAKADLKEYILTF